MQESFSLIRRISQIGTVLKSKFCGVVRGEDSYGNRYYQARSTPKGKVPARWVLYAGVPEATKVPPEWHAWLHYISDTPSAALCDHPLPNAGPNRYVWQKPHHPNLTGSEAALLPDGYGINGMIEGKRDKAPPPYKPWSPPSE